MTAIEMTGKEWHVQTSVPKQTKPIVVATDGSNTSLPAFKVAEMIRRRTGCTVRVVSALEPLPVVLPSAEAMVIPPEWEQVREKNQRDIVSAQVKSFESSGEWVVDIVFGKPCDAISSFARDHNAGLIIVGSNKHGVIGRLLGDDTAVDIARLSEVPLLIATPDLTTLPKRIIVAMDLDPNGAQNTAETLSLLSDAPSISCVHVQPRDEFLGVDWAEYDREYQFALTERFGSVEKTLSDAGLRPDLVALHGNPGKEISDFAEYTKAELVVVGIKRRIGRARAVGGRTARRIIQHSRCSVLIVPNFLRRPHGEKFPGTTEVIDDRKLWDSAMREFTKRNAGRIVSLEVDDPEIGAVVEARNYPLIGVDYDHRDNCLSIILGDVHGLERHLTRTIAQPKAVSILSGAHRDTALSIKHNGGQTLLTF
jgi:nucleotide-binding universal stress UspA family protein